MPASPTSPEPPASETQDDLGQLQRRISEAEERTLEYWMKAVISSTAGSMTVRQMQETVSWRVTRPLRAVRIVYDRARQVGIRRTAITVQERLAQLRQARRRG